MSASRVAWRAALQAIVRAIAGEITSGRSQPHRTQRWASVREALEVLWIIELDGYPGVSFADPQRLARLCSGFDATCAPGSDSAAIALADDLVPVRKAVEAACANVAWSWVALVKVVVERRPPVEVASFLRLGGIDVSARQVRSATRVAYWCVYEYLRERDLVPIDAVETIARAGAKYRLIGWTEIARYLAVPVPTARRWRKGVDPLPVKTLRGSRDVEADAFAISVWAARRVG